ncbi:TPA: SarA family transcriptional regulator [Staphylococcus argenteus]|uniref:HTH-type transcriptional regulator SarT n=4 Tax=Staphylococcus argenteus TaxID=985002 RepID=A0A7U7PWT2_9STAP|nr:SarA family transcriptional regulator [Staphylococcus argenteus]BBN31205.1 staphylococcal accessory regulator T, SarT [Staphylococcus aureus]EKF1504147.1 SarA family transcriptional regulator [Staphylococcus argenteus]EYG94111.1 HTH-type transcriptional regulator sarT [Staphylococcus argenteus]EYL84145.1 HTH-type transcriptional regulator sarT [Staphylococcus argenteus]KAA0801770.1 transcriptional regulator [Staphylococcus argenteus]
MNDLKSKINIKLMKRVLTTYKLRKYLKKYFCLTLDNYLVLAYLDSFKNDERKYFMRDIINYIGIDQSRIVKSVKELSKKDYLNKCRDPHDSRNVIIVVSVNQHNHIKKILNEININEL